MSIRFGLSVVLGFLLFLAFDSVAADDPVCTCREGNACWRWLRAPVAPPDDPCACARCREVAKHTGEEPWPDDWQQGEFAGKDVRLDAFLRRHAASWNLCCSACDQTRLPGLEDPDRYPFVPGSGRKWSTHAREMIRKQLALEKDLLPYTPVVIQSRHFYLVLDIPKMKVQVQGRSRNTTRVAEMHELAHIYIERLEKAYAEFVEVFGKPRLTRPIGVFMPESSAVAAEIQKAYLGHPATTILLGGGGSSVSGGHCQGGFCAGLHRQKLPSKPRNEGFAIKWRGGRKAAPLGHFVRLMDDDQVHLRVRHLLGHALMAAWPIVRVKPESLRPWLYVGVGHWLAKRHPRLRELATYCGEECKPLTDSGKKWDEKARRLAGNSRRVPVEEMCAANTLPEVNRFELHLRAWSWFEQFLEHDRERFVAFLRALREKRPAVDAARATMGMTLAEMDRRWADLVRHRKPDDPSEAEPDAKKRAAAKAVAAIGRAKKPARRAALVRNLTSDAIRAHPDRVLALLADRSAHVRETTVLLLSRQKDPEIAAFLRKHGTAASSGFVVANVVRVLGLRGDREAAPRLLSLVEHGHWLVRANAARALVRIGALDAGPALRARLAKETAPRTKIALLDALGSIGGKGAAPSLGLLTTELGAPAWQVRVAAAHALGRIGLMDAVPDLVSRMEVDGGRVREECYDALKRITRDDLGRNPKHWREWWNRRKGRPVAPPPPEEGASEAEGERATGTADPGEPTYYGIRVVSERVGFVLDVSQSMTTIFRPTASLQRRLRRSATPRPRIEFARDELIDAVTRLDPRASFNMWTFHDVVTRWKPSPVPATSTNRDRARSFLRALTPGQATNYYDALREVLGLPELGLPTPGFRPTPDTVFFLTDGEPTVGEITDADELISWFREENRYARLRCHVIAFGDKNLNFDLLAAMVESSGGTLLHLKER